MSERSGPASVRLDIGRPDHLAPFLGFIGNELAKVGGRKDAIFIFEVKAQNELDDPEVKTKASAAVKWCKAATAHATKNGGKPWSYALISDEHILPNATPQGLIARSIVE